MSASLGHWTQMTLECPTLITSVNGPPKASSRESISHVLSNCSCSSCTIRTDGSPLVSIACVDLHVRLTIKVD